MTVIQTLLRHRNTFQVAFLPTDTRVRKGTVLSLKGDSRMWAVEDQFAQQDAENIQRGWGLDLPKSHRTEK
jgi:hypothetical protein